MYELYDHQEAMSAPMRKKENALLLAPCGSGKTLAVVYNWLKERPTKHLIYVLPTRTLLKSIRNDIVEMITSDDDNFTIFKELGHKIVDFEQIEFNNPTQISIAVDYGEERETKLYAHDIILTTFDSYVSHLYRSSLTPKRYRDLPIARIFSSTSVFDEAQMYDAYTHTLMKYTLQLLRAGKAHHIVMTATLSQEMIEYLELDKNENGSEGYTHISVPDENRLNFVGRKKIREVVECSDDTFSQRVHQMISDNEIQKALIVCNTVRKAQDIYSSFDSKDHVLLLHSKYKAVDREIREDQIRDIIKNEEAFIVATQVVEAGLDISMPALITEIAPGDSLVQRIGRCARRRGEYGGIYIISPENDVAPYTSEEIIGVKTILKKGSGIDYSVLIENELVGLMKAPDLVGGAESKARGIILSAFVSLSAFGDAWINIPTRDSTPVYIYFGDNIHKDSNVMKNCVRVDIRSLYGLSEDLKAFNFYEPTFDRQEKLTKWDKRKSWRAWCVAVPKKGILEYNELGVVKVE